MNFFLNLGESYINMLGLWKFREAQLFFMSNQILNFVSLW